MPYEITLSISEAKLMKAILVGDCDLKELSKGGEYLNLWANRVGLDLEDAFDFIQGLNKLPNYLPKDM